MERRKFWIIGALVAVIFLVAGFSYLWFKKNQKNNQQIEPSVAIEKKSAPIVLPEKTAEIANGVAVSSKDLTSENFTIKQVRFGGDTLMVGDDQESLPMEIYDIKSEVFTGKNSEQSQVLITWKSNKLTYSEIAYAKNNGQGSKTAKESGFGFNHSIVLSGLEQGVGYIYQIKSRDRWNNLQTSGFYGVYSGSRVVSVFELVGKTFNDIFGWALGKK